MNKDPHAVHKTTLAGGDLCQLEHCADGDVVHAHVGHASLRLTPSGFFALRATLLEAPRRMERQSGMLRLPVHTGLPDCGEQYIHDRTVMAVDKKSK
ncbi:MAG TPA: hypothetical protein VJS66_07965, partial [Burkholderiales bacterium]|nr:hypothetical protein [Burkholderiales bacterium]